MQVASAVGAAVKIQQICQMSVVDEATIVSTHYISKQALVVDTVVRTNSAIVSLTVFTITKIGIIADSVIDTISAVLSSSTVYFYWIASQRRILHVFT